MRNNNHYRGSRDWNNNHPEAFGRNDYDRWNDVSFNRGGRISNNTGFGRNRGRYEDEYDEFLNSDGGWNTSYQDSESYYGAGRDEGNFLGRTGERIRETWNRWKPEFNNRNREYSQSRNRDWNNNYDNYNYNSNNRNRRNSDNWNVDKRYNDHENYSRRNFGNNSNYGDQHRSWNDRDHNFFERAGDRIREKWNDWTHHNDRHRNDHDDHHHGRNIFERAGDIIKEKWNEWTHHDGRDRDHRYRNDSYRYDNSGYDGGYQGKYSNQDRRNFRNYRDNSFSGRNRLYEDAY
jgi:hypothetical protein